MGRYTLRLSKECDIHLEHWQKVSDKATLRKIDKIFSELIEHPKRGTGKPEALRGGYSGYWYRRLNKKDRIIYRIDDSIVLVYVISMKGHYGDK
jgi:toxin YoeB